MYRNFHRHSPHGECGLKSCVAFAITKSAGSLPAWGVWIEIPSGTSPLSSVPVSLPAWGVWIEICSESRSNTSNGCHSPHGECGLKLDALQCPLCCVVSLPAWGVWIEIAAFSADPVITSSLPAWGVWIEIGGTWGYIPTWTGSLPAWGVWIEISFPSGNRESTSSLPAWGVWIEIGYEGMRQPSRYGHSPHGECGLKSYTSCITSTARSVTPRMGSVD